MVWWRVFGLCAVLLASACCGTMEEDVDVLARTLWGEARGEKEGGMEAVASVIINRVYWPTTRPPLWWGSTVKQVCQYPDQFEVWNEGNPNLADMRTVTEDKDKEFRMAVAIARKAVARELKDLTDGATHFYAHKKISPPSWANGRTPSAIIGDHTFYKIGPWSSPDEL